MKRFLLFLFVIAGLFLKSDATEVGPCDAQSEIPVENLQVDITNCQEPPCLLKKGTEETIQIKFTADRDIECLTNDVYAKTPLLPIPVPFLGVTGKNACEKLYNEDGTQAGCPLKKDRRIYIRTLSQSFPVIRKCQ